MGLNAGGSIQPGSILKAATTLTAPNQAVSLTGLNLDADGRYQIIGKLYGDATSAAKNIFIYANADETNTNYYSQYSFMADAVISTHRQNGSNLFGGVNFGDGDAVNVEGIIFRNGDGNPIMYGKHSYGAPVAFSTEIQDWIWTDTTTNITTLSMKFDTGGVFAIGSYLRAYKLV